MSEARRYPLSEWGAQRLRRLGIMPSTAAWHAAAWSVALLLCVYGLGATVAAFTEKIIEAAAGYGFESMCVEDGIAACSPGNEAGTLLFAPMREALVLLCGLAAGIAVLALALRALGARPDSRPAGGWRSYGVALLLALAVGVALVALAAWLAPEGVGSALLRQAHQSRTMVEIAGDWWVTVVVVTAIVGGLVAALHQWAARLDFQARWRMTERERRDELRDTQMSPDARRAISRQSNQR